MVFARTDLSGSELQCVLEVRPNHVRNKPAELKIKYILPSWRDRRFGVRPYGKERLSFLFGSTIEAVHPDRAG